MKSLQPIPNKGPPVPSVANHRGFIPIFLDVLGSNGGVVGRIKPTVWDWLLEDLQYGWEVSELFDLGYLLMRYPDSWLRNRGRSGLLEVTCSIPRLTD